MSQSPLRVRSFGTGHAIPTADGTADGAYIEAAQRGEPAEPGYEAIADIDDIEQESRYSLTVDAPLNTALTDILDALGAPDAVDRYGGATHLDYDDGPDLSIRERSDGATQINAHTPAFSTESAQDVKSAAYQQARQAS